MASLDSGEAGLDLAPSGEGSVLGQVLHANSVVDKTAGSLHVVEDAPVPLGETPLLADEDLLPAGELELGSTEGLNDVRLVFVGGPYGEEDLSDPDTSHGSVGLTEGSPHPGLEPISSSARQHFVDSQHVEGVDTNSDVEVILSSGLGEVLVAADPSCLHGLGGQLLQLIGHQVNGQGEVIDGCPLASKIEDTDLRIGHTPVEPRLGVGLVLAVTVATCGPTTHLDSLVEVNQAILAGFLGISNVPIGNRMSS